MTGREASWDVPGTGRRIAYRVWSPPSPKHLLVLLHGYGEHSGRYEAAAHVLTQHGLAVAAPDHGGHGRSSGARGDIVSVDRVVDDELAWVDAVLAPSFGGGYSLFGHSFGGLAAIAWAMRQPPGLRRLIVQSPLLEVGFELPRVQVLAAQALRRAWPNFAVGMNLDVSGLSHDADVIHAYQRDPLVHNRMTMRSYFSLLEARDAALATPKRVSAPTLMLLAGADRIVSLPTARRWFEGLLGEKSLRVFDGAYHELHHEPTRVQSLEAAAQWALAGAGPGAPGALG